VHKFLLLYFCYLWIFHIYLHVQHILHNFGFFTLFISLSSEHISFGINYELSIYYFDNPRFPFERPLIRLVYYECYALLIWLSFKASTTHRSRLHRTELQQKLKHETSVKVLFSQWFSHDENAKIKKVKCMWGGEFAQHHRRLSLAVNLKRIRKTFREKHKQRQSCSSFILNLFTSLW
jgi:hypothetical protein